MFTSKVVAAFHPRIERSIICKTLSSRSRTTYRNTQDHGINIFDKSHTEKLKYKQKDKFFEQELLNPITKADKEMLRDFLRDGKKIRKPSDLDGSDDTFK